MTKQYNDHLDTCGLCCPEPVMLLHKSIRNMPAGNIIEVIASDPTTARDIPKFCHFLGHELLSQKEQEGKHYFIIKKQ
jgi:tRNA 2-thiouridine synthesizing protein A